jgi:hypothetical protein
MISFAISMFHPCWVVFFEKVITTAAVLSYAYWSHAFGRDPKVVGHTIRLQGHVYTIVGIAPEAFTGTNIDVSPDIWTPFADQREFSRNPDPNLDRYGIEIIARLRPGVSAAQA